MNFLTIVAQCAIISQTNEKKRYIRTTEYGETDMLIDEIKLRLRNAIKGSGLSQKEIAARVGVHPSTVSKYVRMEKYPSTLLPCSAAPSAFHRIKYWGWMTALNRRAVL